jgi:hypothetical protein
VRFRLEVFGRGISQRSKLLKKDRNCLKKPCTPTRQTGTKVYLSRLALSRRRLPFLWASARLIANSSIV